MSVPRLRRRLAGLAATLVAAGLTPVVAAAPAHAGQVGVTLSIQGAGRVVVAEGSIEDNGPIACDRSDVQDDRVVNTCPRIRNSEAFEAWVWLRAYPAPGEWFHAGWDGCDQVRERDGYRECAVHSGAFSSDERYPRAIFADNTPPTVANVRVTQSPTLNRTFLLFFTTSDGTPECRLEGEASWAPCANGTERTVAEGDARFLVRSTDASGNVSATGTVDFTSVDTFLYSAPPTDSNSRSARFTYSTMSGTDFRCALDYGTEVACGAGPAAEIGVSNLAEGSHVFSVYARKGPWADLQPVYYSWTVDTRPPTSTLTSTTVDGDHATFGFSSAGATSVACRLTVNDVPGTWAGCTSPVSYAGLADGSYRFEIRGTDRAGNVEPIPASHAWGVDASAPDTTISGLTNGSFVLAPTAALRLGASEEGASFDCTLDGRAHPCAGGGLSLSGLRRTTHHLTATARDAAGNADATPATLTWTVPLVAADLKRGKGFASKRASAAYGGRYLQATRKGAILTRAVTGARRLALVVSTGKGLGKVKVYAGSRLLRTVSLAGSRSRSRHLVPIATLTSPFTGTVRIVSASGRPVRVEGLGVATR